MLSAKKTLRKLHDRRTLSMYFPMEVQQDSFEERSESPDLPEPLYADFDLQVLKSLETSFLSSSIAETQEVPDHPPTHFGCRGDQAFGSHHHPGSGLDGERLRGDSGAEQQEPAEGMAPPLQALQTQMLPASPR
ncbi:arf-GAP with Rho-GAP domain, ANK repeat and PH domain-containing protein 3-like [Pelmatolapia mariae]|uniref:arf-GAP with Rho-GAP domain, ANK repeat and PH domain-containing protein 3-like n=1 Tax=Pelmatolapia mariae TaxID=158779 RepID=UPI002FE5B936